MCRKETDTGYEKEHWVGVCFNHCHEFEVEVADGVVNDLPAGPTATHTIEICHDHNSDCDEWCEIVPNEDPLLDPTFECDNSDLVDCVDFGDDSGACRDSSVIIADITD